MKKTRKLLAALLSVAMVLSPVSYALENDAVTVELDGKTVSFDVEPEIVDGYTMVPLRKIFEEIGALVKWNGETRTVSARKNSKTVSLTVDSESLVIDKGNTDDAGNPITETVTLEAPARIVSERTLVPARAVSEAFGMNVEWDEENRKVIITSDDESDAWKENVTAINLSELTYSGKGVEIEDKQILISEGGDYTLTGNLENGSITVSAKEKVKLRLSGASIHTAEGPCIFVKEADKAYITLTENTENFLKADNSDDGAVYSKENLEIKGDGVLSIESLAGHAIKASDNLTVENGVLNLKASGDAIHINDTFKMTGGTVNAVSTGDGIDSESIVIISGGVLNIETNGIPVESTIADEKAVQPPAEAQNNPWGNMRAPMMHEQAEVEFEKSSKGINAEWMMCIQSGEITVNSASHTIHCEDEIEITGGRFSLSSKYEKGISAHGNLTIDGADTVIDIAKSTEGLESKNIMTINNGDIKIQASDDGINATGGRSGERMGGGMPQMPKNAAENMPGQMPAPPEKQQRTETAVQNTASVNPENGRFMREASQGGGNMRSNMKNCLIINGGKLEICAFDDCLDANGNMAVNGGTVMAVKQNGSFYGANSVIDPDGQLTVGENAELILAAGNGSEKNLNLTQNTVTIYCEATHKAGESITVKGADGAVILEYAPAADFKSVLIASGKIETGKTYTVTVGSEVSEVTVSSQNTVIGNAPVRNNFGKGGGFTRQQMMPVQNAGAAEL